MKEKEKAHGGANILIESKGKGTKHLADYKIVFNEFASDILTMMQVTIRTKIPTQYICQYVKMMREKELIQIHHYGRCPITGYRGKKGVQFLTTNPSLFRPTPKQLNIFSNE